ncbi:MAG: MATE family efflux transporter [Oscillospiraceae bacterium]|nr:MATE family efflux transporter [Oscillospiraceae bacterium]
MRRGITRLALPLIAAQLVNVLYNITDRIFISRIPEVGDLALTGVGVTFPLLMIVSAFSVLCGQGGAPLCSIARGEGDDARAERILGNAFTMLLFCGALATAVGLAVKRPLLLLFGASAATLPYADGYITVYLLGSVLVMISLGMNYYINAQGFARVGMVSVVIGAAANIALDPLFLFVLGWGVRGAAAATVLSQALSAAWVLFFLFGKRAILRLRFKNMVPDPRLVWRIASLGFSSFCMKLTASAVNLVCNAALQAWGGDSYVEIMTIVNSVREMIMLPFGGFTDGAQPVTGFNYGAGQYSRVRACIRFVTLVCAVYAAASWAAVMLFPGALVRIFDGGAEIVDAGARALRIYYAVHWIMCLQMVGQSTFVALGKARQAVFFTLLRKIFIVVPLALILPGLFGLGTDGVFLAEPISDFVSATACYLTLVLTVLRRLPREDRALPAPPSGRS